jgi:hypothetical protein
MRMARTFAHLASRRPMDDKTQLPQSLAGRATISMPACLRTAEETLRSLVLRVDFAGVLAVRASDGRAVLFAAGGAPPLLVCELAPDAGGCVRWRLLAPSGGPAPRLLHLADLVRAEARSGMAGAREAVYRLSGAGAGAGAAAAAAADVPAWWWTGASAPRPWSPPATAAPHAGAGGGSRPSTPQAALHGGGGGGGSSRLPTPCATPRLRRARVVRAGLLALARFLSLARAAQTRRQHSDGDGDDDAALPLPRAATTLQATAPLLAERQRMAKVAPAPEPTLRGAQLPPPPQSPHASAAAPLAEALLTSSGLFTADADAAAATAAAAAATAAAAGGGGGGSGGGVVVVGGGGFLEPRAADVLATVRVVALPFELTAALFLGSCSLAAAAVLPLPLSARAVGAAGDEGAASPLSPRSRMCAHLALAPLSPGAALVCREACADDLGWAPGAAPAPTASPPAPAPRAPPAIELQRLSLRAPAAAALAPLPPGYAAFSLAARGGAGVSPLTAAAAALAWLHGGGGGGG